MATSAHQQQPLHHYVETPWLNTLITTLLGWQQRARLRRHLQELDAHMLRDIGMDRVDVSHEAGKPFWKE